LFLPSQAQMGDFSAGSQTDEQAGLLKQLLR
jgi:hypothetical protein